MYADLYTKVWHMHINMMHHFEAMWEYNIITDGIVQRPPFDIMADLIMWGWVFLALGTSKFILQCTYLYRGQWPYIEENWGWGCRSTKCPVCDVTHIHNTNLVHLGFIRFCTAFAMRKNKTKNGGPGFRLTSWIQHLKWGPRPKLGAKVMWLLSIQSTFYCSIFHSAGVHVCMQGDLLRSSYSTWLE